MKHDNRQNETSSQAKNQNDFSEYSSKIKKIFLELHNYSFFHGPSEVDNVDERFIGRKKIFERLKGILSYNSTKSGAYLVTGHRGTGKSSFVSKAIAEVTSAQKNLDWLNKYIMLFFLFLIASILISCLPDTFNWISLVPSFIIFVILITFIKINYHKNEIIKNGPKSFLSNSLKFVIGLFHFTIINPNRITAYKLRFILQDLTLTFLFIVIVLIQRVNPEFSKIIGFSFIAITYISVLWVYFKKGKLHWDAFLFAAFLQISATQLNLNSYEGHVWLSYPIYAIFLILLFNFFYSLNKIIFLKSSALKKKELKWFRRNLKLANGIIIEPLTRFANFSKRIYIKINFGYDDLKEIDILRLIARNIVIKYKKLKKRIRVNFIWLFFRFSITYLFITAIFYQEGIHSKIDNIYLKTQIGNYFPSQDVNYEASSKAIKSENTIASFTRFVDYNIQFAFNLCKNYTKISFKTVGDIFLINRIASWTKLDKKIASTTWAVNLIPRNVDYLFWLFFIFFYLCIELVIRLKVFGITTHYHIIRRLEHLDDIIEAQNSIENTASAGNERSIYHLPYFSRRRIKQYPIADVREIEKQLIEILEDVRRVPRFTIRPEFIIVFDELDKIEPRSFNPEDNGQHTPLYFSPEGKRTRQFALMKLISNLKFFLTTAKAKFIFIAGREMFDASLADVSDRNYFFGSIFHDIINVDSFLSDDTESDSTDISSMTEKYVCRYLMPPEFIENETPTLQLYNKYLYVTFSDLNENSIYAKLADKPLIRQKREKIIQTLQQFIIYLTHVSNGTPKKITQLFEEYIEITQYKKIDKLKKLVVCKYSNSDFFLSFDYYDQYAFGVTNYIAKPIILNISNSYKRNGDKLLVSTSFLIDQIFKFHRQAFSWRNIELTPELIDIHKTPELRNFITGIIQFLSQTHLQEITSGLHDFKFSKRLTHEISFLIRSNEEASAAFSFSLDESLAIKQYFRNLLTNEVSRYRAFYGTGQISEYIHSISYIQMILGDLHYYDDELGEAVMSYMNGIQELRNLKSEEMTTPLIVLLVRNMLKLGLTFEKRKAYDSAFLTYGELTKLLIGFRDIDLGDFGLSERNIKENDHNYSVLVKEKVGGQVDGKFQKEVQSREFNAYYDQIVCSSDPLPKEIAERHKIKNNKTFIQLLTEEITPLIQDNLFKISSFEGLKLLYQPLLAKLQILEKSHLDGITMDNVLRTLKEFDFLIKTTKKDEKIVVQADFYSKLGDILYYKNANWCDSHLGLEGGKDFCAFISSDTKSEQPNFKYPCCACTQYKKSIETLIGRVIKHKKNSLSIKDIIEILIYSYTTKNFNTLNSNTLKLFAKTLSDLSDTILCCYEPKITFEKLNSFVDLFSDKDKSAKVTLVEYDPVLILSFFSAYFYKKASSHKKYSFVLTKILYIFRDLITTEKLVSTPEINKALESIIEGISKKIIKAIYNSYENIHIYEISKIKEIFDLNYQGLTSPTSLNRISIYTDIEELILLRNEILYRIKSNKIDEHLISFESNPASPYSLNDSIYNRILKLRFKAMLNFKTLKNIIKDGENKTTFSDFKKNIDFLVSIIKSNSPSDATTLFKKIEFLITDSIFCLSEILKLSNTYGTSFMLNHSLIAAIHDKLSFWSTLNYNYTAFLRILELVKENNHQYSELRNKKVNSEMNILFSREVEAEQGDLLKDELIQSIADHFVNNIENPKISRVSDYINHLSDLIEHDNIHFISNQFQRSEAIKNYYQAIETHTNGKAYKNIIENMCFNNDDYNDRLYHFAVASERFRINKGHIQKQINQLKTDTSRSTIYDVQNYQKTILYNKS